MTLSSLVHRFQGLLYRQVLTHTAPPGGTQVMRETLHFPERVQPKGMRDGGWGMGLSLCYSTRLRTLLVSFQGGKTVAAKMDSGFNVRQMQPIYCLPKRS